MLINTGHSAESRRVVSLLMASAHTVDANTDRGVPQCPLMHRRLLDRLNHLWS